MRKGVPLFVLLLALACAHVQALDPVRQSDWDVALVHARANVAAGNYFAADRIFDEFVRTHQDMREAKEASFWKAAYLIDPANDRGSLDAGIVALDAYLAENPAGWYRNEATVLRRTAAVAQGIANRIGFASVDTAVTPARLKDTVVVVNKSRDEQIAALKDQLAKAKEELAKVSAELDRIKKRLANPIN